MHVTYSVGIAADSFRKRFHTCGLVTPTAASRMSSIAALSAALNSRMRVLVHARYCGRLEEPDVADYAAELTACCIDNLPDTLNKIGRRLGATLAVQNCFTRSQISQLLEHQQLFFIVLDDLVEQVRDGFASVDTSPVDDAAEEEPVAVPHVVEMME